MGLPLCKCRELDYMTSGTGRVSRQPGGCDGVVQGQISDVFLTLKPRAGRGPPDVPLPLQPPAAQGLGLVLSLTPLLGEARLKQACKEGMLESQG